MRRLLGLLRESDAVDELAPQPRSATSVTSSGRCANLACRSISRSRGTPANSRPASTCPPTGSSRKRSPTSFVTPDPPSPRYASATTHNKIEIAVADDGTGNDSQPGSGHGLIGIRERVALVGGTLEAGQRSDGGFTVHAVLPDRRERRDPRSDRRRPDARTLGLPHDPRTEPTSKWWERPETAPRPRSRRHAAPEVVLMDVRMPGMDGLETTRRILQTPQPPRVVVLTTFDLDAVVYEASAQEPVHSCSRTPPPSGR